MTNPSLEYPDVSCTFRSMILDDIPQICEIEKECFPTPWTAAAFYNELMNNHFAKYVVMEQDGATIGYGGLWLIMDEAHITNIAVRALFRGQKLGTRLLAEMMALATVNGMRRITLEVRVSNTTAQGLYEKFGFYATGRRKHYYSDNQEDAIIMWAELPHCDDVEQESVGNERRSVWSKE